MNTVVRLNHSLKQNNNLMKITILLTCVILSLLILTGCTTQTNVNNYVNPTNISQSNINTNNQNGLTPAEIKSLTRTPCVTFNQNHRFFDPSNNFYVSSIEPLKTLTTDWQYGTICSSDDNSILVISVSRPINDKNKSELEAINRTKIQYPRLSKDITPNSEDTEYYNIYLYANYPTDLVYGKTRKSFEANKTYN